MLQAPVLYQTADGSDTLISPIYGASYHSKHGALQESVRVYIELGFSEALVRFADVPEIRVFEMGFGTGLNALLTAQWAEKQQRKVHYIAVETQPIALKAAEQLNYDQQLQTTYTLLLHQLPWQKPQPLHPFFCIEKWPIRLQDYRPTRPIHLIFFDAFAPSVQPELWETSIFTQLAHCTVPNGLLTTYCSKGSVQRNLKAAGWQVEKHPGPAHKREVIRAIRLPSEKDTGQEG